MVKTSLSMASSQAPRMSQKDYLKKYLTPKSGDKKRKKKKKSATVSKDKRSIIVDDDEVKTMRTLEDDELDLFQLAEDAPQIAGIIDERPDELRTLETFRSSARWRVVADEDGIEDVKVVALGQKVLPTLVQPSNENEDHADLSPKIANNSSDESPPRERKQEAKFNHSSQDKQENSECDISPPRRKSKWNADSDESPSRKKHTQNRSGDTSPCRKQKPVHESPPSRRADQDRSVHSRKKNDHSDSDESPPRKSKGGKLTSNKRVDSDSDASPPRNRKGEPSSNNRRKVSHSDSDPSPPRIRKKEPSSSSRRKVSRSDSDPSPPRIRKKEPSSSSRRKVSHSDSDTSPPRIRKKEPSSSSRRKVSHFDSDASPPRNRKGEPSSINRRKVSHSDSDTSPPRNRKGEPSSSNRRKVSHSDSDTSPPRIRKRELLSSNKRKLSHSDSDASPPRNRKGNTTSRNRRKVSHSDSDTSPPRHRKGQKSSERPDGNRCRQPDGKLKRRNEKYDADITSRHRGREQGESPPRKQYRPNKGDELHKHRTNRHPDDKHYSKTSDVMVDEMSVKNDGRSKSSSKRLKAPRSDSDESSRGHRKESRVTGSSGMDRNRKADKSMNSKTRTRNYSADKNNSDESPPRRQNRQSVSPRRKAKSGSRVSEDNVPDEASPEQILSKHKSHHRKDSAHESKHSRPTRVIAAVQDLDGSPSRDKNNEFVPSDKRSVNAGTSKSSTGKPGARKVMGGQEAPIYRDRKTGRIRNLEEEAKEKEEESKKTNETLEKYTRWGKGLAQVAAAKERLQDALHEMSKPVARYADDDDLDQMLRAQDREGDPMLDYIRGKSVSCAVASKPKYQGSWMPNRFNIPPGHRWDGVDRSNGYEKQWFEQINARKATEEEAHKWSISDM